LARAGSASAMTASPSHTNAETSEDPSFEAQGASGQPKPEAQRQFFEFPGPLYRVLISPRTTLLSVGGKRKFVGIPQDRKRQRVEENLNFAWSIVDGTGLLSDLMGEMPEFTAGIEPGLVRLKLIVTQGEVQVENEAVITVTDSLPASSQPEGNGVGVKPAQGLPTYTFQRAPGELWRSRFDEERKQAKPSNSHLLSR